MYSQMIVVTILMSLHWAVTSKFKHNTYIFPHIYSLGVKSISDVGDQGKDTMHKSHPQNILHFSSVCTNKPLFITND